MADRATPVGVRATATGRLAARVTKVSTRNFLIGTGIGIIPGVVLFVVAGGGLIELLGDLSTSTRRALIAAVIVLTISRRLWKLRLRSVKKARDASINGRVPGD